MAGATLINTKHHLLKPIDMALNTDTISDVIAHDLICGHSESTLVWHCSYDSGMDIIDYTCATTYCHN